jgi:hypothetical protein
MKHTVNNTEVDIDWERIELVERHDSGCTEWNMSGVDKDGKYYIGSGTYQDDELIEVTDVEPSYVIDWFTKSK